ncbi:GMC family oxidoreductase [Sphingomonas profundi]|uniref:GMC family oxidoreductase n=1 Tax=Alterirhizorhabdus profundi TaxID=2681549 RepID=UPI0018D078A0|nr:GMC family oxidoreductase N-terminal domain-containing protein [Sphingomonas profundi]
MTDTAAAEGYDYLILGGGSAGCVLANRLSADPAVRVCLVEAGPSDRSALIRTPIGIMRLIDHPRYNWRSATVPQANAGGRPLYVPRGRVLGGGSSINGMVYMRGDALDYDGWAAGGAAGWSYAEVLPYFLRSEDNEVWRASPWHGTGGALHVTDMRTHNQVARDFLAAAELLQIPRSTDFNVPHPIGAGFRQVTQRRGRRESAVTAFLDPVRHRPNLTMLTDALVDRVLVADRRAIGARVMHGGASRTLAARREVVVTAGALGSAAILERSGIGDPAILWAAGVAPVHALPGVGANLQDHGTASVTHRTRSLVPYGLSWRAVPRLAWEGLRYVAARRGLLSSNASEAAAFLRTDPDDPRATLQLSFVSGRRGTRFGAGDWGHGYGITAIQLHPWSRGSVHILDADAATEPAIDFAAFDDPRDLMLMMEGVTLARRLLATPPFARYASEEVLPGAGRIGAEAIADHIRRTSGTAYHPVGTCAMGTGPMAVVDPALRLHGMTGLRVADASIMPTIVGGNTNAPVIMIAEKAADLILGRPPPPPVAIA